MAGAAQTGEEDGLAELPDHGQDDGMSTTHPRAPHELWITGDDEADHLLTTSGNALLIGMVLDQPFR